MRKIILFITTSLDGYIARENGDIDWLFTDGDYGYKDFVESVDTVLMGGVTYRQVLDFGGEWPYKTKRSFVFTSDVSYQNNDDVNFVHHDIGQFVKELKDEEGKNIWLVGGGQINSLLLNEGLIDEMWIYLHPVILGSGIPLFHGDVKESWFEIHNIEEYDSGLVKMIYHKKPDHI